jgi:hypothetical protein
MDPVFLALPVLSPRDGGKEWASPYDRLFLADEGGAAEEKYRHLQSVLRSENGKFLEMLLEERMKAVCKTLQMSEEDDASYSLDEDKLIQLLYEKATRMVEKGLPPSMEERFVTKALEVPEASIKREESSVSIVEEAVTGAESPDSASAGTSQATEASTTTIATSSTAATCISTESQETSKPPEDTLHRLLRLRTALTYLLTNYVPPKLRAHLLTLLNTNRSKSLPLDFTPLDTRLVEINTLKSEAQALRSISDNISRKRNGGLDDDEALEKAEAKKRKKEEEEVKKKNVSLGVKKLAKVDTSGMKKLSSFFSAKPGGKK